MPTRHRVMKADLAAKDEKTQHAVTKKSLQKPLINQAKSHQTQVSKSRSKVVFKRVPFLCGLLVHPHPAASSRENGGEKSSEESPDDSEDYRDDGKNRVNVGRGPRRREEGSRSDEDYLDEAEDDVPERNKCYFRRIWVSQLIRDGRPRRKADSKSSVVGGKRHKWSDYTLASVGYPFV